MIWSWRGRSGFTQKPANIACTRRRCTSGHAAGDALSLAGWARNVTMQWLQSITVGVGLGLAAGWGAERIPLTPLVQSVGAFLAALAIGNVLPFWWEHRHAGSGYFVFGVDNVLYLAILGITAAALHMGLDRLATQWVHPLVSHPAVILGCVGGVWGTLSSVWAINALRRAMM